LLYHGIEEPKGLAHWSQKSVEELHAMELPAALRHTLDSHLLDLKHHLASRQVVDLQLRELLEQQEDDRTCLACMQTTPGVGFVTAAKFRLEIFNPQRFTKPEELTSFSGLGANGAKERAAKRTSKTQTSGEKRTAEYPDRSSLALKGKGTLGQGTLPQNPGQNRNPAKGHRGLGA
jgi:transposase